MVRRKSSFRKRSRSTYYGLRSKYHRSRPGLQGVIGNVVTGAVLGIGIKFASPYINRYVPSIGPLSPSTIAILGGGVVTKAVLKKGGKWSDGLIILGSAMAASELSSGFLSNGSVPTGQPTAYANDI